MVADVRLALIRGLHTAIYFVMAGSVLIVLYAGVFGAKGPWLWPALGLLGLEIVVFVGNGLKCPFTALVARLGHSTAVSDTFLPERCTRHTLRIFGPMIAIGLAALTMRTLGMIV
jgi:hypothetical protein